MTCGLDGNGQLGRRHSHDVSARTRPRSDRQVRKVAGDEGGAIEILDLEEPRRTCAR